MDARVGAVATLAANGIQAPKPQALVGEDDDILGEIAPYVSDLSLQFVGLPQVEIVRIFHNKFLSRSTPIGSDTNKDLYEVFQDEEQIGRQNAEAKGLTEITEVPPMRSGQSLSSITPLSLSLCLAPLLPAFELPSRNYTSQFYKFSKAYEWKETLLLLIIEVHSHVVAQEPSDPKQ